jgi:hypothetical protein
MFTPTEQNMLQDPTCSQSGRDRIVADAILRAGGEEQRLKNTEIYGIILTQQQNDDPACRNVTLLQMQALINRICSVFKSSETMRRHHVALRGKSIALVFLSDYPRECQTCMAGGSFVGRKWAWPDGVPASDHVPSLTVDPPCDEEFNAYFFPKEEFASDDRLEYFAVYPEALGWSVMGEDARYS